MTSIVTSLGRESERQNAFYVPRFQVKIAGANLPRDVLYDVRSLTYEDSIDSIDMFRIEVNNWDEVGRSFRYIGSEEAAELKPEHDNYARRTLFEPCGKEVEVLMGYGDNLVTMLRGQFTTMKPEFTDGSAVLSVTGLNVLHQLRRKQYTTTWTDKKDSEIAQNLAGPHRRGDGKRRFPLAIWSTTTR